MEELFSVVQFFEDGSYEYVRERVSIMEAARVAQHYTDNVAVRLGITKRVIITDSGDCTLLGVEARRGRRVPEAGAGRWGVTVYLHGVEEGVDVVLNGFRSLRLAHEWLAITSHEDCEGLEIHAVLPDGERVELDHENRWTRRFEFSMYGPWRTACAVRGLTVRHGETFFVETRQSKHWTEGVDASGVRCAHFDHRKKSGHVEFLLSGEEVARER